jgi:hypothetical protein
MWEEIISIIQNANSSNFIKVKLVVFLNSVRVDHILANMSLALILGSTMYNNNLY